MNITIRVPDDLIDFLDKKAQEATIPTIIYGQLKFVEFFRFEKKNSEEYEANKVLFEEKTTDGEENERNERKQKMQERELRDLEMHNTALDTLKSFGECMKEQTKLMQVIGNACKTDILGD